jgi:hypothetical protein
MGDLERAKRGNGLAVAVQIQRLLSAARFCILLYFYVLPLVCSHATARCQPAMRAKSAVAAAAVLPLFAARLADVHGQNKANVRCQRRAAVK